MLSATACPKRGPWFEKIDEGFKSEDGSYKNQYFGMTCKVVKNLLERGEEEWKGLKNKSENHR